MKKFYREKIISNKIRCALCGEIIESKYRHDFVTCKCEEVSVDGGKSYLKRAAKTDLKNVIELSDVELEEREPYDWEK